MRSLLVSLVSVALALSLASAAAHAQTFQWESLGLADEAVIPSGTIAQMSCGYALRVEWSTSTDGGSFVPFGGPDFVSYETAALGNHTGYLHTGFDNSQDDPDDTISIRLIFNDSVEDLAFSITDVDSGSWDDGIEVFYNGGTNTKNSAFVSFSTPPVFNDNEGYMEGFEGGGTSVDSTSTAGNVDFDFGTGAGVDIDEIELVYRSTDDASADPGGQVIGITDLTFSCSNPTAVLITDVRQVSDGDATWVEWDTAWQADTAGFFAYRWDHRSDEYLPLHSKMVSAMARPDGGLFAALDQTGSDDGEAWYLFEEVRVDGRSEYYGPFQAAKLESDGQTDPGLGSGLVGRSMVHSQPPTWSQERAMDPAEVARLGAALRSPTSTSVTLLEGQTERNSLAARAWRQWLKLEVDPGSVVAVDFATLASHWELSENRVARLADRGRLKLRHDGEVVPWTRDGDRVIFYARDEEPKYSYTTNYWLHIGRGVVMDGAKTRAIPGPSASAVLVDMKSEVDVTALTANANASEDDLYFWQLLVAGNPAASRKSFAVGVDQRVAGSGLSLSVDGLGVVFGADAASTQRVGAFVGANGLGDLTWSSQDPFAATLEVPAGTLDDTSITQIDLDLRSVDGAAGNLAFIDSIGVGYTRWATLDAGALTFEAIEAGPVTMTNAGSEGLIALDVTDPFAPVHATVGVDGDRVALRARAGERFVVARGDGVQFPDSITAVTRGGTWREVAGAEYVVIAPSDLLEGARELAEFRSEYSTMVIDAQELYDFYSDGAADPGAIQRFLKWASRRWHTAPQFVALVGGTTYDRKNVNGLGENRMPTFFARTPHGLFSTDVPFVDPDGDRVPNVAIGRIPAVSNAEVFSYVDKLRNQSAVRGGEFRASFLADNADSAGDFGAVSTEFLARFTNPDEVAVNALLPGQPDAFRERLQNDVAAGLHWANYFGHGGVDRIAAEGLITVGDVASLKGDTLPVMNALTCQIGRLEFPGHQSLAEALVLEEGAGALAVWGASGLSQQPEAREIADAFIDVHADSANLSLGDAINASLALYAKGSPVEYMQTLYMLLGDPAIGSPLNSASVAPGPSGDNSEDENPDSTSADDA